MKRYEQVLSAVALVALMMAAGCGSDEVDEGEGAGLSGEEACEEEEGMVYNPISGECVDETVMENTDDGGGSGGEGGSGGSDDPGNGEDSNGGGQGDENNSDANTGGGQGQPPTDECGYGGLQGQSCGTGGAPLPGADVTLVGEDCDGETVEMSTVAGSNGLFEFEDVPAGTYTLIMESGSFSGEDTVMILPGETTDLLSGGKKVCLSPTSVEIAVLDGSFDDVGAILDDMDLDYSSYGGSTDMLSDLDAMMAYDIIFAECSYWTQFESFGSGLDSDVADNIGAFVDGGGSFYASDQAQSLIQFGVPEAMTFHNEAGGTEGPRVGDSTSGLVADVESDEMQTVLNATTTTLDFSTSPGWSVVASASNPGSTVHFRADAPTSGGSISDAPLMVHYEADGGGSAIFTSFHNSAQSTGDMIDILEYMIFQL